MWEIVADGKLAAFENGTTSVRDDFSPSYELIEPDRMFCP
jgi:hypothetical protein